MSEVQLNDPCPCGSGNDYLHCHGKLDSRIWNENALGKFSVNFTDPQWTHVVANEPQCVFQGNSMPHGILVTELSVETGWKDVANFVADRSETTQATVGERGSTKKSIWRETDIVDLGDHSDQVLTLVRNILHDVAEPFQSLL